MKTISCTKFLTVVVLLLFSCLSWGQKTRQECELDAGKKAKTMQPECTEANFTNCMALKKQKAEDEMGCASFPSREDAKADAQSCKADFDKYSDAAAEGEAACGAFTGDTKDQKCDQKVSSCKKKIASATATGGNPAYNADEEDSKKIFEDLARVSVLKSLGVDPSQTMADPSLASCVKSVDPEKRATRRRELERSRRTILDKLKTLKNEITKETESLDKEKVKIDEENATLDEQSKEAARKRGEKQREGEAKASKDKLQAEQRVREMEKKKKEVARAKQKKDFQHQADMMNLSNEKMALTCKGEMDMLKAAIVNNSGATPPPNATAEEKKNYEAIRGAVEEIKAKGGGASAELRRILALTRKNCLARENTIKGAKNLEYSQAISIIQDEINDANKMIEDMKKSLSLDVENAAKIKLEAEKEAADGDATIAQKKMNLSKKLEGLNKTTEQNIKTAYESIKESQAELDELVLNSKFDDLEISYKEASTAIGKSSKARTRAISSCQCVLDSTGKKKTSKLPDVAKTNICDVLMSDETTYSKDYKPAKQAN